MVIQDADLRKRAGLTSEDVKQVRLFLPKVFTPEHERPYRNKR